MIFSIHFGSTLVLYLFISYNIYTNCFIGVIDHIHMCLWFTGQKNFIERFSLYKYFLTESYKYVGNLAVEQRGKMIWLSVVGLDYLFTVLVCII